MKKIFSLLLFTTTFIILPNMLSGQPTENKTKPTLNHIALYVVDLKKSTDFYKNIIQLDTIPEPFHDGKHTWFTIGPISHLHLIEGSMGYFSHDKHNHICFTVTSVPDFIIKLKKYNIAYENLPGQKMQVTIRTDGVNQIYFKDPDGYWIEINDAKY